MTGRELILLSPYRVPAQNPLLLASEDVAAFLNGFAVLWHPAALSGAVGPPRVGSPYDYEQPSAGHVYALPESPPLILPDDWDLRVRAAGAFSFAATSNRATTLANLLEALRAQAGQDSAPAALLALEPEKAAAFFGIGFGHLMLETLCEAMEHENILASADFWQDVQSAVAALADPDPEAWRSPLQSAADRLLSAREVLYPVNIHLLDLWLLDQEDAGAALARALERTAPRNLIVPAALLEKLGKEFPDRLATLRQRAENDQLEVCGGPYLEREDALLPLESQLWNLLRGLAAFRDLLGREIRVFARRRFAAHPHLPLLLNTVGLQRAVLLPLDEAVLPTYRAAVTSWPSPDGKQVDTFTRMPHAAENAQTYFHWAHYLHKTISQDHSATLALLHTSGPAAPWYDDLLALHRLGNVFGQWTTLSHYLEEVVAGEYAAVASPDEFHGDYLSERTTAQVARPVSGFACHVRLRRRIDTVWTLAALSRGLLGANDPLQLDARLREMEERIETTATDPGRELVEIEEEAAQALAGRLLARAPADTPGFLLLNPCSFARRVALELEGIRGVLPLGGPLKAFQSGEEKARLVVEVPPLGFAWIPGQGPSTASAAPPRMRLADAQHVRNEFFEAEIDPATGGLRALRDPRSRVNRLGQQLVFNPGSSMHAQEIQVSSDAALGEIVTVGEIRDEQERVLARFRQRFRAWLGRPMLELRMEISPLHAPEGHPWHAYYGARFAWREERATLLRGVNGTGYVTSQTRPESPDYLELRSGRQSTTLFPGGLPFHQRHGARMLDIILVCEGETERVFDIGLGLDREYPMQTALGMVTPVPVLPVAKGPPHVGTAGWLFHLDAPNLLLSSFRPAPAGADAVVARLLECSGHTGPAEFRCARDPRRAVLVDAQGTPLLEANTSGDAALFDVVAGDLVQVRIEFA